MSAATLCPRCSRPLVPGDRFCGSCGNPVAPSSALPTEHLPPPRSASAGTRFLPGVVLAGRYQLVGLLGKGGMGEVYRADDLKLGQPVALKFLPPGFEADPDRLQRFLNEVRTARQVSHTNVCRIYDAGEADGQHFLSMEYVDGEDLASLLRRIGHLPKDKAIQIARQLCAGLAAAHEIGVLHRDLKPANIMIDGRGRARITDFGLAAFAGDVAGEEILSGTPAYMAPEQLAGRDVSVRSDLYSLGLVLYELFTGKQAFGATSVDERRRLQSKSTPSTPSSLMEGFDPLVERVILRCLDADPARRPSSALAIAAALPGGDPLAAALAAGETPSPQMVAEAGDSDAAPALVSWGALALFLATVVACVALAPQSALIGMVRLDKPPEVLRERAREILAQLGYDKSPADSLFAFDANGPYLDDLLRREGAGRDRWAVLSAAPPSGILFWYRESPKDLEPLSVVSLGSSLRDPPDDVPGMARVGLDPEGRLVSLLVVPPEHTAPGSVAPEPDWEPLLRATGADLNTLSPVPAEWSPPVFADRRAAWTASWPGKSEAPLRVEAAAAGGRVVSLRLIEPWTQPAEAPPPSSSFWNRAPRLVNVLIFVVVLSGALLVALRNVRRSRGDRRGALRVALYLGAARLVGFLGAHHSASSSEVNLLISHLALVMFRFGLAYVAYLALEPYARRLWPRMLVSWVRVLEGRLRDPLVGRDLLLGCAAGAIGALLERFQVWVPALLGGVPALPIWSSWGFEPLRGTVAALAAIIFLHSAESLSVIFPMTLLLVFRLLLRRTGPALVVVSILGATLFYPNSGSVPLYIGTICVYLVIYWVALFRVGLLAVVVMFTMKTLLVQLPLTPHPAGWYAGAMLLSLAFILAPALYGFWTSRAGRPLFGDEILEPALRR